MTASARWRNDGVTVVRAGALEATRRGPGAGRATVVDFTGAGGRETWIGTVTLAPGRQTGAHHHGRHEVAVYVAQGRCRIRWGERLEFATEVGRGDFVYFAPFVPHEEINLDVGAPVEFVVVRSDGERLVTVLDIQPVETPQTVF